MGEKSGKDGIAVNEKDQKENTPGMNEEKEAAGTQTRLDGTPTHIELVLGELEQLRKRCLLPAILAALCFALGMILTFLGLTFGFLFVIAAVVCLIIFIRFNIKYKKAYKERLVRGYLETFFEDLEYRPDYGIAQSVIEDTDMIAMGNTYKSEDYIAGRYHDVQFQQSDVIIQQVTHHKDSTDVTTYFSGRWMIFAFNKNFSYDLQVKSKNFAYATKPGGLFNRKKMQAVEMENGEFNRTFKIYAGNEHEAFYLLTPHLCEAMMRLKGQTGGALMFCFTGNRLHVALNNRRDSFEPKLFSSCNAVEMEQQILGEIRVITAFVDEMKLERDLFKTEE